MPLSIANSLKINSCAYLPLSGSDDLEISKEDKWEEKAPVLGAHLDLKWFIADNVAVSGALIYNWASEYIFEEDEDTLDQIDLRLQFGMRGVF